MNYSIEDIKKAITTVLGDGEAAKLILNKFNCIDSVVGKQELVHDDIVVKGTDLLRIIHINDKGIYKCKNYNGIVFELNLSDIRPATDAEKNMYHIKQLDFIRTNISPFLNFFHMRQLAVQIKEESTIESMSSILDGIERECLEKLQDIKKLW